jgi:hypothetical protein
MEKPDVVNPYTLKNMEVLLVEECKYDNTALSNAEQLLITIDPNDKGRIIIPIS